MADDEASFVGTGTTAVVPLAEEDSGAPEDCSAAEDSEAEAVFDGAGWLWLCCWLCWLWLSPLETGGLPDLLSVDEGPAGEPESLDEAEGVADCCSDEVAEGAGALEADSEPDELWG